MITILFNFEVGVQEVKASTNPITMVAFDNSFSMPGMADANILYGDTWDSCWLANGDC